MVIPKVVDYWSHVISGLHRISVVVPKPISEQILSSMLNHVLEPELRAHKLDFLQQQWVRIEVPDLDLMFSVTVVNGASRARLRASMQPQPASVTMRGNCASLLLMVSGQVDPDTLFFRRKLLIKGDTELGLEVKNLLDTIELEGRLPAPIYRATQQTAALILAKPELR
ncbi:ubiquinone anaerobic biosynthesis accessory factor UbiT [Pseudidiomarina sp.]|uniref:ubiquinone anaerobic biosynthesis accessory factor UbiT n=1 Tax=Pseudidiomarina sp. TaxID=2081707 RepID=UPI003A969F46